jgi:16S rRNA (uracil1498-N3)-methyltransferase
MRSPRVFTDQPLASGTRIALDSGASRHLLKVLRLRPGAVLRVFNGTGNEFAATVVGDTDGLAHVDLGIYHDLPRESPLAIHLGMGIAKGERMDWIVQKAVELGAAAIAPLFTERSEVRLTAERVDKKHRHWQQIAVSACEQCGRNRLPFIAKPHSLSAWLAKAPMPGLVLDPDATLSLGRIAITAPAQLSLLIGPEGGLTATEIRTATTAGFTAVSLGPRILRTETAPLAAISILQARWGDLG